MELLTPSNSSSMCRHCFQTHNVAVGLISLKDTNGVSIIEDQIVMTFTKNYQKIPAPTVTDKNAYSEEGIQFTVMIRMESNYTTVVGKKLPLYQKILDIIVPGQPFTPANVKDKVSLYMVFS